MDINEHIIIDRRSKSDGRPKEMTADIASISFDCDSNRWKVYYNGNPREYPFKADSIEWFRFSNTHDLASENPIATRKGVLLEAQTVDEYESYSDGRRMFRVHYKSGAHKLFEEEELRFEKRADSFAAFSYLKKVCEIIESLSDKHSEFQETRAEALKDYYLKQYETIERTPLDTLALKCYIAPNESRPQTHLLPRTIICPFGANLSQIQAVENALTSQLSIIEGPPGTGKTQTILNIIANLIMQGKSVLVVSPNNHATNNISEKLAEYGYGFLVAKLGNKDNVGKFQKETQTGKYPEELNTFLVASDERERLMHSVANSLQNLREMFEQQRELQLTIAELDDARRLLNRFRTEYPNVTLPRYRSSLNREQAEKAYERVRGIAVKNNNASNARVDYARIPLHIRARLFLRGIGDRRFYREPVGDILSSMYRLTYEIKVKELVETSTGIEASLEQSQFDDLLESLKEHSSTIFRAELFKRYGGKEKRQVFSDVLRANQAAFRSEYPVVTSTVDAALNQLGNEILPFDYVIIDEASQADVVKGALALASGENAVIVGDTKQLSPVIGPKVAQGVQSFHDASHQVPPHYSYLEYSLLSSLVALSDDQLISIPRQLLREHYRSNPLIIRFCNEKYYNGELIPMTENKSPVSEVLKAVVSGRHDREGDYNRRQADDFMLELKHLLREYNLSQIGVATPYKRQVFGMESDFRFKGDNEKDKVYIGTIHKFQGREKEVVAFITVRNTITSFLDNPNLVNVAVSRAKTSLMVFVANSLLSDTADKTNNISELVRYIEYQGGEIKSSEVSSIYDALSDDKKLHPIIQGMRGRNLSSVPSEILTEKTLQGILERHGLQHSVLYQAQYPLNRLFKEGISLSVREWEFIRQGSHVDIIVYLKMDKSALFGIEVNGAAHFKNPRQRERDELKHSIFKKAGLGLLTLPTHGSAEEQKIEKALLESLISDGTESTVQHFPEPIILPDDDEMEDWVASSNI